MSHLLPSLITSALFPFCLYLSLLFVFLAIQDGLTHFHRRTTNTSCGRLYPRACVLCRLPRGIAILICLSECVGHCRDVAGERWLQRHRNATDSGSRNVCNPVSLPAVLPRRLCWCLPLVL